MQGALGTSRLRQLFRCRTAVVLVAPDGDPALSRNGSLPGGALASRAGVVAPTSCRLPPGVRDVRDHGRVILQSRTLTGASSSTLAPAGRWPAGRGHPGSHSYGLAISPVQPLVGVGFKRATPSVRNSKRVLHGAWATRRGKRRDGCTDSPLAGWGRPAGHHAPFLPGGAKLDGGHVAIAYFGQSLRPGLSRILQNLLPLLALGLVSQSTSTPVAGWRGWAGPCPFPP